jgi:hypothetical protein
MTMKTTRLTTWWSADEAQTIIEFLDQLRDTLWETYGDKIADNMKQNVSSDICSGHANIAADADF